jgi:hypothetical protein
MQPLTVDLAEVFEMHWRGPILYYGRVARLGDAETAWGVYALSRDAATREKLHVYQHVAKTRKAATRRLWADWRRFQSRDRVTK